MNLKIKPLHDHLKSVYDNHMTFHNGDSGLDVFTPADIVVPAGAKGFLIPLGIQCEAEMLRPYAAFVTPHKGVPGVVTQMKLVPTSFILHPRSSICRTPLRVANSSGIIDASYRGELMLCVDNINDEDCVVHKGVRLCQILAPALGPIESVVTVDVLSETTRGEGGIGSTGK